MRPLGITSAISGGIGILIIVIAQGSIPGIIGNTLADTTPDLSGPLLWSWIGGAFIGIAVTTFILELLMVEVRGALRTSGAVRTRPEAATRPQEGEEAKSSGQWSTGF